jgi:hypothetical protein
MPDLVSAINDAYTQAIDLGQTIGLRSPSNRARVLNDPSKIGSSRRSRLPPDTAVI